MKKRATIGGVQVVSTNETEAKLRRAKGRATDRIATTTIDGHIPVRYSNLVAPASAKSLSAAKRAMDSAMRALGKATTRLDALFSHFAPDVDNFLPEHAWNQDLGGSERPMKCAKRARAIAKVAADLADLADDYEAKSEAWLKLRDSFTRRPTIRQLLGVSK